MCLLWCWYDVYWSSMESAWISSVNWCDLSLHGLPTDIAYACLGLWMICHGAPGWKPCPESDGTPKRPCPTCYWCCPARWQPARGTGGSLEAPMKSDECHIHWVLSPIMMRKIHWDSVFLLGMHQHVSSTASRKAGRLWLVDELGAVANHCLHTFASGIGADQFRRGWMSQNLGGPQTTHIGLPSREFQIDVQPNKNKTMHI